MGYKVPLDNTLDNPKKAQKEQQQKIDDAVELTEEEQGKYIPSHLSLYFYEFSIKKVKKLESIE